MNKKEHLPILGVNRCIPWFGKLKDKQIRILMAIVIHLVTFLASYVYFRYLYVNGKLLSVSDDTRKQYYRIDDNFDKFSYRLCVRRNVF